MPSSIPGPIWDGMNWEPYFDPYLHNKFGDKSRRLVTFVPKVFTCRLMLSEAQRQVFEDFFEITCSNGTTVFQWWDFSRPSNTTQLALYRWLAEPGWTQDGDHHVAQLRLLLLRRVPGHYPLTDGDGGLLSTPDNEILTT